MSFVVPSGSGSFESLGFEGSLETKSSEVVERIEMPSCPSWIVLLECVDVMEEEYPE